MGLLFGYINHFIEVNGYKAVLVANEAKIIRNETLSSKNNNDARIEYERKKEKLVGRTFEVASDLESACKVFFAELKNLTIAKIFKDDIQSVEAIYTAAG